MRVFGIDCGTEFTGFGVVQLDERARTSQLMHVADGTIRLNKKHPTPQRLAQVYAELIAQIELHAPDVVAIEEVFFSANAKSALKLGQVRGVAMLAAATCGKPVAEYAPLSIKSAVVGYGLAAKDQVQFMVQRLLHLELWFASPLSICLTDLDQAIPVACATSGAAGGLAPPLL